MYLSDKELDEKNKFYNDHAHGNYFYSNIDLIPSFGPIGTKIEIKCGICGEVKDITDYDLW